MERDNPDYLIVRILWGMLIVFVLGAAGYSIFTGRKSQGIEAFGLEYQGNEYTRVQKLGMAPETTNLTLHIMNAVAQDGEFILKAFVSIHIGGDQAKDLLNSKESRKKSLKWTLYSGHRNYAPSVRYFTCDPAPNTLTCYYDDKLDVRPKFGNLVDYPLDRHTFKLPFLIEPRLSFDTVKVFNHTQCNLIETSLQFEKVDSKLSTALMEEFNVERIKKHPPQFLLTFKTKRNSSLVIAYYTVFAYLVLFLFLFIWKVNSYEGLLAAVTGFFFSVWSLRQILDPKDEIPMDLLDTTIVCFSILILSVIFTKMAFNRYSGKVKT